jgi:hypothetical protein
LLDATPLPCGTSRETAKRSVLADWAGYGYCASYSRFYWCRIAELDSSVNHINAQTTPGDKPPFALFAAEFGLRYQRLQRDWALWAIGELDQFSEATED